MKYLPIILLFTSCMSEKKAYRIVNEDVSLDTKQRQMIRQKCMALFPVVTGIPVDVSRYVDSSEYNAAIDSLLAENKTEIENLMAQFGEQGFIDTNDIVSQHKLDSLRIIQRFLKTFKPKPVKETIIKEIPTRDSKAEDELRAQLNACDAQLAKAEQQRDDAMDEKRNEKNKRGWYLGIGLLGFILAFLGGRFIR